MVEVASSFAFGYEPTGRSIFLNKTEFIIRSRRGVIGIVGWVEPTEGFVGFRCTQPNLRFASIIGKCETQQRLISALRDQTSLKLRRDKLRNE